MATLDGHSGVVLDGSKVVNEQRCYATSSYSYPSNTARLFRWRARWRPVLCSTRYPHLSSFSCIISWQYSYTFFCQTPCASQTPFALPPQCRWGNQTPSTSKAVHILSSRSSYCRCCYSTRQKGIVRYSTSTKPVTRPGLFNTRCSDCTVITHPIVGSSSAVSLLCISPALRWSLIQSETSYLPVLTSTPLSTQHQPRHCTSSHNAFGFTSRCAHRSLVLTLPLSNPHRRRNQTLTTSNASSCCEVPACVTVRYVFLQYVNLMISI
ncbi:hypothetical protein BDR05DRAFT_706166 [Suillus weaverae]|nr:hypothetical protein BDR05DRAFT_706166 [Suillus weaverae]